jgi:hypothetical protein
MAVEREGLTVRELVKALLELPDHDAECFIPWGGDSDVQPLVDVSVTEVCFQRGRECREVVLLGEI